MVWQATSRVVGLLGITVLGTCAAVPIAVLYPLVARGDKIQKILAAILLIVPVLGLFYAVILAANLF